MSVAERRKFACARHLMIAISLKFNEITDFHFFVYFLLWGFPVGSESKESACNTGGLGSIPGLTRFSEEGSGYLLQYSGMENSMDRILVGYTLHNHKQSDMTDQKFYPGDFLFSFFGLLC